MRAPLARLSLLLALAGPGCGEPAPASEPAPAAAAKGGKAAATPGEPTAADDDAAAADDGWHNERWTGDFDAMVERRRIRVLTVFGRTSYFLDGPTQRGVVHDIFKEFEKVVNAKLGKKTLKVDVVFIPVRRDQLLQALVDGLGDIAAANLTVTPGREELVEFASPVLEGAKEVAVTGPQSPAVRSLDDLSGREVWVRESSSYHEHLRALNERFRKAGKEPVSIQAADENLEDEDILEMVEAGLLPLTVVDDHKARFWAQVFEGLVVHEDVAVNEGGSIAWAFRKGSPQLAAAVNDFVKTHKLGTFFGNMMFKRHLKDARYVKNVLAPTEHRKLKDVVPLLRKYAGQYDFDWILIAAQGYQESGLDQSVRSPVGAIGVMQVMPATARDPNVGIPDIEKIEPNIHAGVKYLRFVVNRYFDDPAIDPLNRALFAFASYNAGPNRVVRLRKKAATMGLDPNRWFQNVEVAVAKDVGREPVQYVSNIYKYYIAYTLIRAQIEAREDARAEIRD